MERAAGRDVPEESAASRGAAAQQPTCRQQLLIGLQQGLLQCGLALGGGRDARPAVQGGLGADRQDHRRHKHFAEGHQTASCSCAPAAVIANGNVATPRCGRRRVSCPRSPWGLPGLQAPLQTFGTAGLQQTGIRAGAEQRLIPLLGGPLQQAGLAAPLRWANCMAAERKASARETRSRRWRLRCSWCIARVCSDRLESSSRAEPLRANGSTKPRQRGGREERISRGSAMTAVNVNASEHSPLPALPFPPWRLPERPTRSVADRR